MAPSSLTKTISDMPGDIEKDNASVHVVDTDLEHREVSPEDNKRIRRKIDLILLPLLMTVYGLQFVSAIERQRVLTGSSTRPP